MEEQPFVWHLLCQPVIRIQSRPKVRHVSWELTAACGDLPASGDHWCLTVQPDNIRHPLAASDKENVSYSNEIMTADLFMGEDEVTD